MNKKIFIALISLVAPCLIAELDLYDRISLAIKTSDVIRTKNLVRQLDDLDLTSKEKKKALRTFKKSATEVVELHPPRSFRDTCKVVLSSILLVKAVGKLWAYISVSKQYCQNLIDEISVEGCTPDEKITRENLMWERDNLLFLKFSGIMSYALSAAFFSYLLNKGVSFYHESKTYDKALRIEKWLNDKIDKLDDIPNILEPSLR